MRKLFSILSAAATALAVLTGSIAVPLLIRPFYHLHIQPLALESVSGLSEAEIREVYDQIMDYCLGLRGDFSAGVLPFSESGASHFADVRFLFLLDLAVLAVSLVVLVLLALYCRGKGVRLYRFRQRGPAFWGCVGLGTVMGIIGILAAMDFSRAFTVFHTIFFPGKDNWIFSAQTDPVILLLPQTFFCHCALLILTVLLLSCAVLIAADFRKRP